MIRAFYSLLMWLAQPFLRRKLARRGQAEPGYLEAIEERFAAITPSPAEPGMLWLHAVSLGETRAAAVLLDALRKREPGLRVLLTHGTATGRAEGQRLLRPGDAQGWLPWDTPGAVRDFLDHFRPRIGVLMETEVWPNLVAQCKARGVPLVLANAGLSDKSLQQVAGAVAPVHARLRGPGSRVGTDAGGCQAVAPDRCRGAAVCSATSSSTPRPMWRSWRRAVHGARLAGARW
jgi:3-deoxy-D-manno-octulosonic-acid transferase